MESHRFSPEQEAEFSKSRKKETEHAQEKAKEINKDGGRSRIKALFGGEKLTTAMDVLQEEAQRENSYQDYKKREEKRDVKRKEAKERAAGNKPAEKREYRGPLPFNFDSKWGAFVKMRNENPEEYRQTVDELAEMAWGGGVQGLREDMYPNWDDEAFLALLNALKETEAVKKVKDARKTGRFVKSR